jgi:hypothetical protein
MVENNLLDMWRYDDRIWIIPRDSYATIAVTRMRRENLGRSLSPTLLFKHSDWNRFHFCPSFSIQISLQQSIMQGRSCHTTIGVSWPQWNLRNPPSSDSSSSWCTNENIALNSKADTNIPLFKLRPCLPRSAIVVRRRCHRLPTCRWRSFKKGLSFQGKVTTFLLLHVDGHTRARAISSLARAQDHVPLLAWAKLGFEVSAIPWGPSSRVVYVDLGWTMDTPLVRTIMATHRWKPATWPPPQNNHRKIFKNRPHVNMFSQKSLAKKLPTSLYMSYQR